MFINQRIGKTERVVNKIEITEFVARLERGGSLTKVEIVKTR